MFIFCPVVFWFGVYKDVLDFCASCPKCQLTDPQPTDKPLFIPLQLIGVNWNGHSWPLEKSATG